MKEKTLKFLILLFLVTFSIFAVACTTVTPIPEDSSNESSSNSDSEGSLPNNEPTEGVIYSVDETGEFAVVTGYEGSETDIVIAKMYKGVFVKSIGEKAFYNCTSLTSVVMPDCVTTIGDGAFHNCQSLTSIVIPKGVTTIGDKAFRGCISLEEIEIPFVGASKEATGYEAVFGYIFGYYSNSIMTQHATQSGTSTYQYRISTSFYYYYIPSSLTKVTITGGNIPRNAFYNCDRLTSVVFPDGMTSIGASACYNCDRLTSVVIPDSVTSIDSSAFSDCDSLTSVIISDNVTSIGSSAFAYCDSLTSIVISDSVTSIGSLAFDDCESLASVYYKGNVNKWNTISVGPNNANLTSATICYYVETEPTEEGNFWHYAENGEIVVW